MEKNKQYVAIIHMTTDFHEITPKGEISGKVEKTNFPHKQIIKIQGETLDEVVDKTKAYINSCKT